MFRERWSWWRLYSFGCLLFVVFSVVVLAIAVPVYLNGHSDLGNIVVRLGAVVVLAFGLMPMVIAMLVLASSHRDNQAEHVTRKHIGQALAVFCSLFILGVLLTKLGFMLGVRRVPIGVGVFSFVYVWTEPLNHHPFTRGLMSLKLWRHREPLPGPD